jgi:hypothetical protein
MSHHDDANSPAETSELDNLDLERWENEGGTIAPQERRHA